jgi:anaerobic selenocysteine-containing dehydrogenase
MPNGDKLFPFDDTQAIREEMSRVMPMYQGIEKLAKEGDQLQWGGPQLYVEGFTAMPAGRALFTALEPPDRRPAEGKFYLATRRGKQFNSMIQERRDSLTGAVRDAVLIGAEDAARLGIADGEEVVVRSEVGELRGRALIAPLAPGNVQVHWPEGNVLIAEGRRSAEARIPDYNARVTIQSVPEASAPSPGPPAS